MDRFTRRRSLNSTFPSEGNPLNLTPWPIPLHGVQEVKKSRLTFPNDYSIHRGVMREQLFRHMGGVRSAQDRRHLRIQLLRNVDDLQDRKTIEGVTAAPHYTGPLLLQNESHFSCVHIG